MPEMGAPKSGVKVRMYRQGHGDCFLLAFRDADGHPFYLLIDCGYKPGSQVHANIDDVVNDIGESTAHRIHVVLVTHEHQDHVNGFWNKFGNHEKRYFNNIAVDHLWLAWTEDPRDELANYLRRRYRDTLLGLMAASEQFSAATDPVLESVGKRVEDLLAFEIEGDREEFVHLAIDGITNKRAIKFLKDKTGRRPLYLRPDHRPYWLPNVAGVRIYALGPPRDEDLLLSPEPIGGEGYARLSPLACDAESFLTAAVRNSQDLALNALVDDVEDTQQPFSSRYRIPEGQIGEGKHANFFAEHYGAGGTEHATSWRRIDREWLRSAETLALRLNDKVNNTCLVTAIELPNTKRVLLFVGDAQRGNWISWDDQRWIDDDGETTTARDLLGRTVLYKVGHHGSHNATLKGYSGSDYPNLGWMAQGDYRNEFVAMIPANREWAYNTAHWRHPLRSIERALSRKAKGRVFRLDVDHVARPSYVTQSEWRPFEDHTEETELYFEYWIPD